MAVVMLVAWVVTAAATEVGGAMVVVVGVVTVVTLVATLERVTALTLVVLWSVLAVLAQVALAVALVAQAMVDLEVVTCTQAPRWEDIRSMERPRCCLEATVVVDSEIMVALLGRLASAVTGMDTGALRLRHMEGDTDSRTEHLMVPGSRTEHLMVHLMDMMDIGGSGRALRARPGILWDAQVFNHRGPRHGDVWWTRA